LNFLLFFLFASQVRDILKPIIKKIDENAKRKLHDLHDGFFEFFKSSFLRKKIEIFNIAAT
jgi:hypothetical protein